MLTMLAAEPPSPTANELIHTALQANALADVRVEVTAIEGLDGRCTPSSAEAPVAVRNSGRLPVRLNGLKRDGSACEVWAWAHVRAWSHAWVTRKAVKAGESLDGSIELQNAELLANRSMATALSGDAVAARDLQEKTMLEASMVRRPGPGIGQQINVVLRIGALEVAQVATSIGCAHNRICARLMNGTRVEGEWSQGRLVVMAP